MAIEQQFSDQNCAFTVPDAWQVMTNVPPQVGLIAVYSDVTGKRRVALQIINKKPSGPLDDRFIAGFEQGIRESGGGNPLSAKFIEVGGIKSYERQGTLVLRGRTISTMTLLVPGENQYYNLQALRFDGDASEDPEIQQIIGSFRFLHPFVPTYAPDSIAYRIGQLTGALMVIIVVVAFVIFSARPTSRNRTTRPTQPPPLPPGRR
jgi:hypothetical protein